MKKHVKIAMLLSLITLITTNLSSQTYTIISRNNQDSILLFPNNAGAALKSLASSLPGAQKESEPLKFLVKKVENGKESLIFIDFVNMYLNLDSNTDVVINIPDIYVPNFEEYKIISATTFNWSELLKSKESLNTLWQLYLAFVDVFLILNFINLCESKYNRIFGGDTSNYEYYTVEDSITYDNDTGEVTGRRMNERRTTRKKV